jgi:hypothetical protein
MRNVWQTVAAALILAAVAGLSASTLLGALFTGAIDGLARGLDLVAHADQPVAFWLLVLFHLVLCAGCATAAYRFTRGRGAA